MPFETRAMASAERRLESDLETLRRQKVRFNKVVLKLPPKKAREWADRTIRIVREAEREESQECCEKT